MAVSQEANTNKAAAGHRNLGGLLITRSSVKSQLADGKPDTDGEARVLEEGDRLRRAASLA
jgi:hypothetical protein